MARHIMMLIDTSKCIGCKACQVACQQWHSKTAEDTQFTGSYENPPEKSGTNFNVVKFFEHETGGELRWLFFPDRCRHCLYPHCKYACPLNAVYQFPWGGIAIYEARCDTSLCNKECELACPYKTGSPIPKGVPRFEYEKNGSPVILSTAQKCDFCYDRFNNPVLRGDSDSANAQDGPRFNGAFDHYYGDPARSNRPACEVACPTSALQCAYHDDVIPYAKNRVKTLKALGFPNANLYPLTPQGTVQTHMLWVLTEPLNAYGLS